MNPGFGIILLFLLLVIGAVALVAYEPDKTNADWKGKLERRFVLSRLRREWGRWCYRTDCCGETKACWWEHDPTVKD
jgi:hypothetical protein